MKFRKIAFAIKPARTKGEKPGDPVVFLIGGPGLSTTYYSEIDGYEADDLDFLNENREVILIDYRGLGESNPLPDCEFTPDLIACRDALMASDMEPELRSATIVRDVDRVLESLGYDSVALYGESWGTRVALTMIRDVPTRVSHLILDGVFPPEVGLRDDPVAVLANLDHLAAACEASDDCMEQLGDVRAKIEVLGERWIGREDAANLFAGLAAVGYFPSAPLLVHELWSRSPEDAAQIATQIYEWTHEEFGESPVPQAESFLMMMTLICAEEANLLDEHGPLDASPYRIGGAALEIIASHTFGAPVTPDQALGMCKRFPTGTAQESEVTPVHSDIPTLILSGGMDLDTSFAWGALAASRLPNARHLVFPFSGHVTAMRDVCASSIAIQFLANPTGELDTRCHDDQVSQSHSLVMASDDILAEVQRYIAGYGPR